MLAAACLLGLALTYLVALHTGVGVHDDAELYRRASGYGAFPIKAAGARVLRTIDFGSVGLAVLLLVALGVARRRAGRAAAAVGLVACSVGSVELLKHGLAHVPHALPPGRPASFPSGHTSIALSLGLALVLAAPSVLRPTAAVLGAAYAAGIGLSLVVLGWHYPSDVAGAFFLCGFWACVAAALLRDAPPHPSVSPGGLLVAAGAVAVGLVAAAAIAERHPAAVAAARSGRTVVGLGALLGLLSVALFAAFTPLAGEPGR